ncbi:MAG: hypothetical protein K9F92_01905 [Candidatus Nanopelagicaceae bacterium]|nr:hypothetical protein [Candidatus Nanopelagicaceae bacterium]
MVLSLLSGLPPKPRGIRRLRSAWRRRSLKSRRKRDLAEYAKRIRCEEAARVLMRSGGENGSKVAMGSRSENGSKVAIGSRSENGSKVAMGSHARERMSFAARVRSEDGSVESALVVIPLLALFLISFQLVLTVTNRNILASYAQSSATHSSITGQFANGDRVIDLDSPDAFKELKAVVSTRNRQLPNLVPFLDQHDRQLSVNGFSILEGQS